jgi:hypothetical protein
MLYFKSNFLVLALEFDPSLSFTLDVNCMFPILGHLVANAFILKRGNLDKFESRSSDGIFLGYTTNGRSYSVLNHETNTIIELCDVTFNENAPCTRDVFESAGDKETEESIFVNEELQSFESDEDEHIAHVSTSSPGHVPASTLETEVPQAATSSSAGVHVSRIKREINSEN